MVEEAIPLLMLSDLMFSFLCNEYEWGGLYCPIFGACFWGWGFFFGVDLAIKFFVVKKGRV